MKNPFTRLFHARDKPKDSVSSAPTFYFGSSNAGKSVSVNSAVQLSAVYACVRVIELLLVLSDCIKKRLPLTPFRRRLRQPVLSIYLQRMRINTPHTGDEGQPGLGMIVKQSLPRASRAHCVRSVRHLRLERVDLGNGKAAQFLDHVKRHCPEKHLFGDI